MGQAASKQGRQSFEQVVVAHLRQRCGRSNQIACRRSRETAWGLVWLVAALLLVAGAAAAQQYKLSFNKSSTRMRWAHTLPSWNYAVPVQFSAAGDSSSMLRISGSASLGYTLDQRQDGDTWQDNASARSSVNYPILGPKASIGISASMSTRNSTLQRQKIRSQSFNFSFQYKPLREGPFRTLSVGLTPGLITATRASRAAVDSTIEEQGIQYNASMRVSPDFKVGDQKLNPSFSFTKRDNTLKNNKDLSESVNMSMGYTWPRDVRTSFSVSESRSQRGVTRSRAEEVLAEIDKTRSTSASSSLSFKLKGFDFKQSFSFSENLRNSSANADTVDFERNRFFGRDRQSDRWKFSSAVSGKLSESLVSSFSVTTNRSSERRLPVKLELAEGQACPGSLFKLSNGRCRDLADDRRDRDLFTRGSLDWKIGDKQSFTLAGHMQSIADDNPGTPEQNRDTFNSSVRLSFRSTTANGTKLDMGLSTTFTHRVSLDATRSSENSRNRDIGLDVGTRYERLGVSISHKFSLSAKRTIFDFDRNVNRNKRDRKSNIRRGWSMSNTLQRKFFRHLQLNTSYSYRADDFGRLIVESGSQLVQEDNSDHSFRLGLSYTVSGQLSLGSSYGYSLDREWGHEYANQQELRFLRRRNARRNLGANISYNPKSKWVTSLTARASSSRQLSGTFNSFSITYGRAI
ncbi:MAG: hypothetical protein GKR89_04610 [Candidatus Latescibacteria bacterium]|nr:hypothetical protein [Candidatus Latescibacterota bacterium]